MAHQVISLDLATEAGKEEAVTEAIVDEAFEPTAPMTSANLPAPWVEGTTYAKGALVSRSGSYYRSLEAGNKEHDPATDSDFVHWTPVPLDFITLQNADYYRTPSEVISRREP